VGSIEGECIRCFYHGWKYDGLGQCVDQPAEGESVADNIRIPGYPVQEYIGLIFAYVGEGDPPPLPRYPRFESPGISLDVAALRRICNYFNNIDNSLDNAHVRFVHQRHRKSVDDHVVRGDPMITVEESEWGIRRFCHAPRRDRANRPGSDRPAQQRTSRPQRSRRLSSAQNLGTRAAHPSGGQANQAMDLPAGNGADIPPA